MKKDFTRPRALAWQLWGLVAISLLGTALAWRYGPQVWSLAQDEAALEAFVAQLGPWGPLMLITINAAQIVFAPLPGYVMQAAAGYLYGPLWGGIWGAVGLVIGAMLAMGLSRYFGRPIVERLVGSERLDRWERVTFSTSTVIWFLILLAPTGDLPYFMAGLARVSFTKILLLTLLIRVPTTFLVAAAGAGALEDAALVHHEAAHLDLALGARGAVKDDAADEASVVPSRDHQAITPEPHRGVRADVLNGYRERSLDERAARPLLGEPGADDPRGLIAAISHHRLDEGERDGMELEARSHQHVHRHVGTTSPPRFVRRGACSSNSADLSRRASVRRDRTVDATRL